MIDGETPTLSIAAVRTIAVTITPILLLLLSIAEQLCLCVFIKLHITAQPGPVKLIFQCYSNGSALWGISGCDNKTRQKGHALVKLSLATTYFYFIPCIVPLATPSPFSLLSWPLMLIPLFLHVSCLGLATCCCRSKLTTAAPRSLSWTLVLLLQFGEVRLTPCLQG